MRNRARTIGKISDQLSALDHDRLEPVERDGAVQLGRVLKQLCSGYAGERRIMVSGDKGVLKSTTTELLLGRAVTLERGPHPVTAVATEFHLTQGPATAVEAPYVLFLTKADSERRLARVRDEHDRTALAKQMAVAKDAFGYGNEISLKEFDTRGGGLSINALGPALIERVVRPVAVRRETWDLSWAGKARVVLIDTPGARVGGALEEQVRFEQQGRAHLSLELVEANGAIAGRPIDLDCPRILVLTKVDGVAGLDRAGAPRALGEAIAATRRQEPTNGRIPVVAICPQWAFQSAEKWRDFDTTSEADDLWNRAVQARERWNQVSWPPDAPGIKDLEQAIRESTTDGGFSYLRHLIGSEAATVASGIDQRRIGRLEATAEAEARQLDSVLRQNGTAPSALSSRDLVKRRKQIEVDDTMFDRLRSEVTQIAGDEVYAEPAWEEIVGSFDLDGVWDLGEVTELGQALARIDLERVVGNVTADLALTLGQLAAEWLTETGLETGDPPPLPQGWAQTVVDNFALLSGGILKSIDRLDLQDRPPTMREMARARHEVSRLLSRMLLDAAHPYLEAVRRYAVDRARPSAGGNRGSELAIAVRSVIDELQLNNAEEVA